MANRSVALGELADDNLLVIGAGRPRSEDEDLPVLRVADVLDGRVQATSLRTKLTIPSEAFGPKASRPGDVVLTTKGTVGRVAIMPSTGPTYAYSPQLCFFRSSDPGPLLSRYLYYWFKSSEFLNQAAPLKAQTDMADFISLHDIRSLTMTLPSTSEQRAIVAVLGALDDKIAANTKLATTVDEYLGAKFERIAAGGSLVELGKMAAVNPEKRSPAAGSLRYIDISSVGVGSYSYPDLIDWSDAPGRARRGVRVGDIVWSSVRPNRRSHALVMDDDPLLVASTGLVVLRSPEWPWVYEAMRRKDFTSYLENVAEGSAYPAVKPERFGAALIPSADETLRTRFNLLASGLRRMVAARMAENRRLAASRDALLPELMSGRLTVRDVEAAAGDLEHGQGDASHRKELV